jgi:prepilin-type N-terminal cleavage/methylation domain-containing protein
MRRRAARERGFSLVEMLVVVALIMILAATSVLNARSVLLTVRVQATASDMGVIQNALRAVAADCGTLPQWAAPTDPGLMFPAAWAAGCWKGPYLNDWLTAAPVGGSFLYVGTAGNPPVVRVAGVSVDAAQRLAAKIQTQFGSDAVGAVSTSGSTWNVDLVVRGPVVK